MGKYRVLGALFDRVYRNDLNSNFNDVDTDIKEQKKRVDDLIVANPQPSEVQDARGGFTVLRDRLNDTDTQLAETAAKLSGVKSIEEYGITNDGTLADWQKIQDAITECITNGFELKFGEKVYQFAKGVHIPYGKGSIVGVEGTRWQPKTQWKFLQVDGTDCVLYGNGSQGGNQCPYIANIYILGSINTGIGLNLVGDMGLPKVRNVFVGVTGKECVRLYRVFLPYLENVSGEKWDSKRVWLIEGCGLVTLNACSFNNASSSTEPSLHIKDTNSVNAIGANINGQKGIFMENSQNCYIDGYQEFSAGAILADQPIYACWFDEKSKRNEVRLQSVNSVIDFGYDNKYETTLLSNKFAPINPKKLVHNVQNAAFDVDTALSGINKGTITSATVVNVPGKYSGNSIEITVPIGNSAFYLTPANAFNDQSYYVNLESNKKYAIQFSIKADGDYPNVRRNDSLTVQAFYSSHSASHGINYAFPPIYKDFRLYQWSFTLPSGITKVKVVPYFLFTNNTGAPRKVWITDIVLTSDLSTNPDYLNAIPTTGTWLKNTVYPKSNDSGGFKVTDSGTFKSISPTTANTTANSTEIIITSGNISEFKVGEFIDVDNTGIKHTRRIVDIDVPTNKLYLSTNFGYTLTNTIVTIHTPTFVSY